MNSTLLCTYNILIQIIQCLHYYRIYEQNDVLHYYVFRYLMRSTACYAYGNVKTVSKLNYLNVLRLGEILLAVG